jgi:hypothetical protein
MRYQDAIKKINKLLGLYKFNSYKVAKTGEEIISDGDLAVGEPIYVITSNGQLPAPDGEYELEDTTKIKIEDGKVKEIKYDMENQTMSFTEATMKDGTVLKSPTFDLGEDVLVVGTDGKETPAPDGEHEIALKDSKGNETTIRIVTQGGKITERENVEEAQPELPEVGEDMSSDAPNLSGTNAQSDASFKKTMMEKMDAMMAKIEQMSSDYEDMKAKVAKFSKEPAGEPVRQAKNMINEFNEAKNDYIEQLVKVRRNSYGK